jgi:hypothetical protein
MYCKECNPDKIVKYDFEYLSLTICHDCGKSNYLPDWRSCCNSPYLIQIMVEQSNGAVVRRSGCKTCKQVSGKIIKKGHDWQLLPKLSKQQKDEYEKAYNELCEKRRLFAKAKHDEIQNSNVLDFKKQYHAYLQTPEWKAKAEAVKMRDNYLCQACLSAPASDAHHLHYQNIFNEPLFDLVSVCRSCHDKLHKND